MKNKLFIIGNGFDLDHNLPTSYSKFRDIMVNNTPQAPYIWDLYTSQPPKVTDAKIDTTTGIWSDFENNLSSPDFNNLDSIFTDYDFNYDVQCDILEFAHSIEGTVEESLKDFIRNANEDILNHTSQPKYKDKFDNASIFLNFNYTSTLERLYDIGANDILHIHGSSNKERPIFGYPGNYSPNRYINYDIINTLAAYGEVTREQNPMCFQPTDRKKSEAFNILNKYFQSLQKSYNTKKLQSFVENRSINEIEIIGHAYSVDFQYFKLLNTVFPNASWTLNWHDDTAHNKAKILSKSLALTNPTFVQS